MNESRWTIAQALMRGRTQIEAAVPDTPLLDAQLLLMHVLGCDRTTLFTWPEHMLTPVQADSYFALVARRIDGHPVAHLTGRREFWSLPLAVNPSTLIPRPDTEVLVAQALEKVERPDATVLELGTGTGAIALALQSEQPNWKITAVDYVEDAVALARQNAQSLGFSQLNILQSDWFSAIPRNHQFHLIVSNPPYLASDDVHLKQGDVRFEPHSALVAEDSGFADLIHIARESRDFLTEGGWLMLEHGAEQGSELREVLQKLGYVQIYTALDYANLERVTCARFAES